MENNEFNDKTANNLDKENEIHELFIQIPTDENILKICDDQSDLEYNIIDNSILSIIDDSSDVKVNNLNLDFDISPGVANFASNNQNLNYQLSKENLMQSLTIGNINSDIAKDNEMSINNVSTFLDDNSSLKNKNKHENIDSKKLAVTFSELEISISDSINETTELQSLNKSTRIFGNFDDDRNSMHSFLNNWWTPDDPRYRYSHDIMTKKKLNIDFSIFQRDIQTEKQQNNFNET